MNCQWCSRKHTSGGRRQQWLSKKKATQEFSTDLVSSRKLCYCINARTEAALVISGASLQAGLKWRKRAIRDDINVSVCVCVERLSGGRLMCLLSSGRAFRPLTAHGCMSLTPFITLPLSHHLCLNPSSESKQIFCHNCRPATGAFPLLTSVPAAASPSLYLNSVLWLFQHQILLHTAWFQCWIPACLLLTCLLPVLFGLFLPTANSACFGLTFSISLVSRSKPTSSSPDNESVLPCFCKVDNNWFCADWLYDCVSPGSLKEILTSSFGAAGRMQLQSLLSSASSWQRLIHMYLWRSIHGLFQKLHNFTKTSSP